jgi:preprotein translocase subunit SecD
MIKSLQIVSIIVVFTGLTPIAVLADLTSPKNTEVESGHRQPDTPDNGFYIVIGERFPETRDDPPEKEHAVVVYDHAFLNGKTEQPDRYMVIDKKEFIPLRLDGVPERSKDHKGHTILGLKLDPEHSKTLELFTQKNIGGTVAIVIGGKVITMHKIRTAIKDGKIQITRCTDNACEYIYTSLMDH